MTPNTVLTQLPRAQEAYKSTLHAWESVDTTDLLLAMDKAIRGAMEQGSVGRGVGNIPSLPMAEKAAWELEQLGYHAVVNMTGQAPMEGGGYRPLYTVAVNWRFMPPNTRDGYSV